MTTPPAASPPTMLLLQRRRSGADCARWRTVLRLPPAAIQDATTIVLLAERIYAWVRWRLAADAPGPFVEWRDGTWG
jgi:hypothetical protein